MLNDKTFNNADLSAQDRTAAQPTAAIIKKPLFERVSQEERNALLNNQMKPDKEGALVADSLSKTETYAPSPPLENKHNYFELPRANLSEDQIWEIIKTIVVCNWIIKYDYRTYMLSDGIYVSSDMNTLVTATICLIMNVYGIEPEAYSICTRILNEAILRSHYFKGLPNDERYTLFQNGFVDNVTGRLYDCVPDYFATMRVEANFLGFDRPLYHPETDKFLATIAGSDPIKIKLLWQVLGYCIASDAKAKAIFILYGPNGDNGKSTFLSFLKAFISTTGVKNLSLKNLLGNHFALSELQLARVNISADEGAVNLDSEAIGKLKNISGHDSITADVKNRAQVSFLSTCKILIASNSNIGRAYSATDPAFARRAVTIPFDVSIPKEQQDPNILTKLIVEMDDVATEAMRYYLELRNNNYQFAGREQFNCYLNSSPVTPEYDLIRLFSDSYCDFSDPEAFTFTSDLYNAFKGTYGEVFKDVTAFSQAFNRVYGDRVQSDRRRDGDKNCRGYYGVKFK